jgi:hypothetical protein
VPPPPSPATYTVHKPAAAVARGQAAVFTVTRAGGVGPTRVSYQVVQKGEVLASEVLAFDRSGAARRVPVSRYDPCVDPPGVRLNGVAGQTQAVADYRPGLPAACEPAAVVTEDASPGAEETAGEATDVGPPAETTAALDETSADDDPGTTTDREFRRLAVDYWPGVLALLVVLAGLAWAALRPRPKDPDPEDGTPDLPPVELRHAFRIEQGDGSFPGGEPPLRGPAFGIRFHTVAGESRCPSPLPLEEKADG